MIPHTMKSSLSIHAIELSVYLGWSEHERAYPQRVWAHVDLYFPKAPEGCETDHLDHTVCYATLIQTIRAEIATKSFHLVEHLSQHLHQTIKSLSPPHTNVHIAITKRPDIEGLGHVCFRYGDRS